MNTNGHEEKRGTYAARVRISAARRTEARWLLPLLPKKEERAGERRPFFIPLSSSLPARSSRGEREKGPQRFYAEHYFGVPPRGPNEGALPRSQHRLRPAECRLQRIDVPPSRSAQRNTIRGVGEILLQIPAGRMPGSTAGGRPGRYNPNSLRFSSHDASTGRSGTLALSIACSSAPALSGKPTWPPSAAERCNASMISAP